MWFEALGWLAFFGVEEEHICAYGELGGEAAEDVEGWLAGAGFIASELGDVDGDAIGECGLGESAFFAEVGESLGEVHGEHREGWVVHVPWSFHFR